MNSDISDLKCVAEDFEVLVVDVVQVRDVLVGQHGEVELCQFLVFVKSMIYQKNSVLSFVYTIFLFFSFF